MTRKAPAGQRPGQPEIPAGQVLAFLAMLFGAGALGWALLIGVAWLAWAYTLVVGSIVAALAVVTLCVYLAIRGNVRARVLAAVIFGALVVLVAWAAVGK